MKASSDWHSRLRCLWKQDQMPEMSLGHTFKRQCSKGWSIWSIPIMLQSLVMNYSSEYVVTSHFHVCVCKNRLSAVRWLHPLKISLEQRPASETSDSESSLAKITLHKQRLQQIINTGVDHVTRYALLGLWSSRVSLLLNAGHSLFSTGGDVVTHRIRRILNYVNKSKALLHSSLDKHDEGCTNKDFWEFSHMVALLFTRSRKSVKQGQLCESRDLTDIYSLARLTW